MIVKMKKVVILLAERHRDSALKKLRKLGVLHLQPVQMPISDDIQMLENKIEQVDRALKLISSETDKEKKLSFEKSASAVEKILSLHQEQEKLSAEKAELLPMRDWFEKWGAVSGESLKVLKENGILVRFYQADKKALKEIPEDKIVHIAHEDQGIVYLALFGRDEDDRIDLREVQIPAKEFVEIQSRIAEIESEQKKIEKELSEFARSRGALIEYRQSLEKQSEISRAKYSMGEVGEIVYLQGFCPIETVEKVESLAEKEGWGYLIDDPDEPADVPTLLRNPKWVEIIKPLFDFMGTLPGYNEKDVSLVFLAFFSVFYAMIVGDAGYGLIFLLGTLFFDLKKKSKSRDFFRLMYLLSITTIIWGVITGTYFGAEKISQLPFLKIFIINDIYSFNPRSSEFIMQLTFIIGVVHLSIGHLMSAFQRINSLTALAEIGWVLILGSVYFIADNIVLGSDLSALTLPLLIAGVALVLLFANFQKNIIKGILSTLGNLPLDIISAFSDVVSYIRLFAVGLATVIVAQSFNQMALGSGINSVVSGIIAALVLLLGHGINLALCGMSILVHGVRLNMLEFSGHVGVQWSGKPYQPFKE
ncbi:MAG: hypothetical protein GXO74_15850 [Calditrichaeota bacterium]|nr:hypothetical protein [Calditrichota bacterium]